MMRWSRADPQNLEDLDPLDTPHFSPALEVGVVTNSDCRQVSILLLLTHDASAKPSKLEETIWKMDPSGYNRTSSSKVKAHGGLCLYQNLENHRTDRTSTSSKTRTLDHKIMKS